MNCLYCKSIIIRNLTFQEILFPFRIRPELCKRCQVSFEKHTSIVCNGCGRSQETKHLCVDCCKWKELYPNYDFQHHARFKYNDSMKEWIYKYKFLGDYQLAKCFSSEVHDLLKNYKNTLICPIPLSNERLKQRGFNQTASLLLFSTIPFIELLEKKVDSFPQSEKNRIQRLETEQPFQLKDKALHLDKSQKILIFDDIYTTGRTLFHAADCFLERGFTKVTTASLIR